MTPIDREALPATGKAVVARAERSVLITGGAGFVGANRAHRLLMQGESVLLFDNLSRPGMERNVSTSRTSSR